jgi:hypothetical protein
VVIAAIIAAVGAVVALLTFIKAVVEYAAQNRQKRAEYFMDMRHRFKDNQSFSQISGFLEPFGGAPCNPELEKVRYVEKRDFLGFFQELAIQMNSGLIPKEVVHYMFGYYALRCWDCKYFWKGVEKESPHWKLFKDFVQDMQSLEDRLPQLHTRKKLRF